MTPHPSRALRSWQSVVAFLVGALLVSGFATSAVGAATERVKVVPSQPTQSGVSGDLTWNYYSLTSGEVGVRHGDVYVIEAQPGFWGRLGTAPVVMDVSWSKDLFGPEIPSVVSPDGSTLTFTVPSPMIGRYETGDPSLEPGPQLMVGIVQKSADGAPAEQDALSFYAFLEFFGDVDPTSPFVSDIQWLKTTDITRGGVGSDGSMIFGPTDNITREAMAAFIYRFMGEPAFTPPTTSPFTDLDPETAAFYKEITWLESGAIEPGGGDFSPTGLVTREVQAQWIFRALTTDAEAAAYTPSGTEPFTDVDPTHPSYTEISWMWDTGLSTGADIGGQVVYAPDDPITREAMAAFFHRADTAGLRP